MKQEDWLYLDSNKSEYHIYTPSVIAKETYFYPLQIGEFSYAPGYYLSRDSYDSFLLLYVSQGSLQLVFEDSKQTVSKGQFMLIDCYQKHEYYTEGKMECLWMHFDGIMARPYYNRIKERLGNVFSIPNTLPAYHSFHSIFTSFSNREKIQEALISKYITDILTEFLTIPVKENKSINDHRDMCEDIIRFITEHFTEDLTVEKLSDRAGLSPFHFIRSFKQTTGYTPHEYIIHTRLSHARFLLSSSSLSIKDICYSSGFSNESVFCTTFKKKEGMSPTQYRNKR